MVLNAEEIKKAVAELPQTELEKFRVWYANFDAEIWDKQIEADINTGKLEALADAAIADHKAGRSTKM